jgi:hypothetical protein
VTAVFWAAYQHICDWWPDHEVIPVVAVSDDPVHRELAPPETVFCEMPNAPLGRKFNATLTAAREIAADVVCITGSDDVMCERITRALEVHIADATPYVGLRDLYFHETWTGRTGYWPGYHQQHRIGEPAGCHRLIRREVLDKLDWHLWDDDRNHGMDHSSFKNLTRVRAEPVLLTVRDLDGCAVDLKSATNLWSYDHVKPQTLPDDAILDRLPEDVTTMIRDLWVEEPALIERLEAAPVYVHEAPGQVREAFAAARRIDERLSGCRVDEVIVPELLEVTQ